MTTNILNLFKFIESVRPQYKIPAAFMLKYNPDMLNTPNSTLNGFVDLQNSEITSLADGLTIINGGLNIENTKITTLPDRLTVDGAIIAKNSQISSIPNNLKCSDWIDLRNTPLSKQYSSDEFKKIVQDKGGYIDGYILI